MHTRFHRAKRFILILAGTAMLSGSAVPLATADVPTGGSGQPPADAAQCQNYQNWFNQDGAAAGDALVHGNLQTWADYTGQQSRDYTVAKERGCDVSTWDVTSSPGTVRSLPPVVPVLSAQA
jgi:hypothetical protein